jgi:hypothetical protein
MAVPLSPDEVSLKDMLFYVTINLKKIDIAKERFKRVLKVRAEGRGTKKHQARSKDDLGLGGISRGKLRLKTF